jgi:hypothetical protein
MIRVEDKPEDQNADEARRALWQLRQDVADCHAEHEDIDPTTRERIILWWERLLGGRILDKAERRLRGIQGRN